MHRYWRIDFRASHTSCWFQMGTLPLYWVEPGRMQCLDDFCFIFKIPFFSPTTMPEAKPHCKTRIQEIVLVRDPFDHFHYNGWMARRRQKSKAGNAAYCSCNWPYDEVMWWYVYLLSTRSIYIYIIYAWLPWNSTIDTKYKHIWSRRYIIQTYPKHHCW